MNYVIIVDSSGFFVTTALPDELPQLQEGERIVNVTWPDGLYRPRHDAVTDKWVEGLTQTEIDAIHNAPKEPTSEQRLASIESTILSLMGL